MEVSVIATTHPNYTATKDEIDHFGGLAAGVCYMANDFATLKNEDKSKTEKRANLTKESGHHSVYDHSSITLYLHCIPRVLEVLLNNERYMVSSVKSGRYTLHPLPKKEQTVYDKWLARFQKLIAAEYKEKSLSFFTDNRIKKLAMENARYVTSCFTMTSMLHTMSYRQLNYVYGFLTDYANQSTTNNFEKKLKPYILDFLAQLDRTGYIDPDLMQNGKSRKMSLFNDNDIDEYFGDVYATKFSCSFVTFAHLNRHRTLKYHIHTPTNEIGYYIPEIIADNEKLKNEWLDDLDLLKTNYPQAMMVNVVEMGNLDDFILKVIERKCAYVQLETTRIVNDTLRKYYNELAMIGHRRANELKCMMNGARCTFNNFKCNNHCGFIDAIRETRKV
jgi:thymidylate synthase ThyX